MISEILRALPIAVVLIILAFYAGFSAAQGTIDAICGVEEPKTRIEIVLYPFLRRQWIYKLALWLDSKP